MHSWGKIKVLGYTHAHTQRFNYIHEGLTLTIESNSLLQTKGLKCIYIIIL